MNTLLALTSLILLVFSALLLWQFLEQKKMIAQMLENEGIPETSQDPELILTLRVLDPISLAKRESRTGRLLADRLPVPESVTSLANIPVKPTSAPTRGDNWVRF